MLKYAGVAALLGLLLGGIQSAPRAAQSPPLDLWTPAMPGIRDPSTLRPQVRVKFGYSEVTYTSEAGSAKWAESDPPYTVHRGDTIRIRGYLASPLFGGPYPAIVIGHGHRGSGSPELAMALAALGYVALSIDGPNAGGSTGGPDDTEQAWISVEEEMNRPAPEVSYLYHYAYAGMRGLTLLEALSLLPLNPYRIDRTRLGVLGASMGGQFTYYVNGVDSRVKAAVAIAVAGDWEKMIHYEGSWLYHGLFYYTRDGLRSGQDHLNAAADACDDPTLRTFLSYFDPIAYAPRQHGPLLTILGTHDQYFPLPGINTTYDRTASAGTHPRWAKRIMMVPNGKHGVADADPARTLRDVLENVASWLRYCFRTTAPVPPATPAVRMDLAGDTLRFRASVPPGQRAIRRVDLHYATQIDSFPETARDFTALRLTRSGNEWLGSLPVGKVPRTGPPVSPQNVLYFVTVRDAADYTVTSKMQRGGGELVWGTDFAPRIDHWSRDDFPVPPPPPCPE